MPKQIFERLKEGNKRFVEGLRANHDFVTQRKELKQGQNPFAIVLACSDSRVISEYIFDTGLGDLFVVRTAGNILDKISIASIEFAVSALGVRFIMVMGHEECGAVKKAIESIDNLTNSPIIAALKPSVNKAKEKAKDHNEFINYVIHENIYAQFNELINNSQIIRKFYKSEELYIVGAYYQLETGLVEFIELK